MTINPSLLKYSYCCFEMYKTKGINVISQKTAAKVKKNNKVENKIIKMTLLS